VVAAASAGACERCRGGSRVAAGVRFSAVSGVQSAKADFVPFQRRVSNPSFRDGVLEVAPT
jgi:hypothetical protein